MTDEIFKRMHAAEVSERVPSPQKEDFSLLNEPWCKEYFLRPDFVHQPFPNRRPPPPLYDWCSNSLVSQTLSTQQAIRAWCIFMISDPSNEVYPYEYNVMMAVGTGLDGMTGRGHGGFISMILDMTMGYAANAILHANATMRLEVDYKKAIPTPCLLLVRNKIAKIEGRKCWITATLEDGKGTVFASGTSQFVRPKGYEGDGDPRGTKFSQGSKETKL